MAEMPFNEGFQHVNVTKVVLPLQRAPLTQPGAIPPMAEMQAMWWCRLLANEVKDTQSRTKTWSTIIWREVWRYMIYWYIHILYIYTLCISHIRFFFLNDSNFVSFAAFRRETLWTAHAIDLQIPGSVMVRNWVPLTWLSNENLPLGIHSKWHEKVCRKRFFGFLSHLMIILYPQESSKN